MVKYLKNIRTLKVLTNTTLNERNESKAQGVGTSNIDRYKVLSYGELPSFTDKTENLEKDIVKERKISKNGDVRSNEKTDTTIYELHH